MQITLTHQDTVCIVGLTGELDAVTCPELEASLRALLLDGCGAIIFNFTGLTYISSAGLRAIYNAVREIRRRAGKMALCGAEGDVRQILDIVCLTRVVPTFPTLDDALKAILQLASPRMK